MKDLYEALEHKDKQLHDFMRTYDHVSMSANDYKFDFEYFIGSSKIRYVLIISLSTKY